MGHMNLKEAFRYQKFLSNLLQNASVILQNPSRSLTTTKLHKRHAANPEAEDVEEIVDEGEFVRNDTVLAFMIHLVGEKQKLSTAITDAKRGIDFDIDAAVETNKCRQIMQRAIGGMLRNTGRKIKSIGNDYKFDVNGQQVPYRYEVDITTTENYDKDKAKAEMRSAAKTADEVSKSIDAAMVNTVVDYAPPYDVNESFDDALEAFAAAFDAATQAEAEADE